MQKTMLSAPRLAGAMLAVLAIVLLPALRRRSRSERKTRRLQADERALRDLVTVFEHTTDYVVQTDARGRIHYMNPALRQAQGIGPDETVQGLDVTRFNTPETNGLFVGTILPAAEAAGVWIGETTVYVAGRRVLPVNQMVIAHKGSDGRVHLYSSVMRDITEQVALRRRQQQESARLLQLSRRDPLTGLLNRAGFEAFLEEHGATRSLALLYIDLDRFKAVNDTHGHAVGDRLLQQFAQRLQGLVSPADAVARLGGDEFAIALAGLRDGAQADAVAEQVVAAAGVRFEVAGLGLEVGASVGVALGAPAPGGWHALIARADRMLYQAKAAGRGRFASLAHIAPPARPISPPA
jgi:diguanylate cyclase (GGDEF)-like protein/PAS domain S-box-containing protein